MKTSLPQSALQAASEALDEALAAFARRYPGENSRRQPVHSVYGGAHLFRAGTARRLGDLALGALEEYAPSPFTFARAVGLPGAGALPKPAATERSLERRFRAAPDKLRTENRAAWLAFAVYARVLEKLQREPVEDYRIDFEDGYGYRSDAEEDQHAKSSAEEVARGMQAGSLPPFIGVRIKAFSQELRDRSIRTLDLFLTALCEASRGRIPENFVVTLPKVVVPEQPATLAKLLEGLESELGLAQGCVRFELMIETPQAILNARGESNLPRLLEASAGRCSGAHFGAYDYTASFGITVDYQSLTHQACDFARNMMQLAFAGTGVQVADSITNTLPTPIHRVEKGQRLTRPQQEENREAVHRAWRLHYNNIRHSLSAGFYQSWDVHPAQLLPRYAAVYSFFLESLDPAATRLRNFIEKATQATRIGDVFDDAATGQGLLNFFLRAINCGALSETEAERQAGVTAAELRGGSFLKILKNRMM